MLSKRTQEQKREKKRLKRERIDKTTNQYMITLAWGVLVIILLRLVESGFNKDIFQTTANMKIFSIVFLLAAAGLFVCGVKNLLNKKSVFIICGVYAAVMAVGCAWIGFYADIRNIVGEIMPAVLNIRSDWWYSKGPIVLVVVYLVAALIWTAIKVSLIEKGKIV